MKEIRLGIFTLLFVIMFSSFSFAGEWKQDDKGYWYQKDDGSYKTGWFEDVDGKWYYFDLQTGYMLSNTVTPDGFMVNENGMWIEGEGATKILNEKSYEKSIKYEVMAYNDGHNVHQFVNTIPVTVYYNEKYSNEKGGNIEISGFSLSKEGVLYVEYTLSGEALYYELAITTRYIDENGNCVEENDVFPDFLYDKSKTNTGSLMGDPYRVDGKIVSAEVYIDIGNTD